MACDVGEAVIEGAAALAAMSCSLLVVRIFGQPHVGGTKARHSAAALDVLPDGAVEVIECSRTCFLVCVHDRLTSKW